MLIVADDKIPFLPGALESVGCQVSYLTGGAIGADDVREASAILTRTRTCCNAQLLDNSSVRFIGTATIGFDHLDTAYLAEKGISWCNAPGCNAPSVRQYLTGVMVSLLAEGALHPGAVIGIIGVGQVGSRVAQAAQALGFKVLLNDPPRAEAEGAKQFVELDELLDKADFITCHVPRNRSGRFKTENLADHEFFEKIKHGAYFVNTSRGEIVDEAALVGALRTGHCGGAVIDVWRNEPTINLELLELCRIATQHIAGYSADGKANGTTMTVQALSRYFKLGLDDWSCHDQLPPAPEPEILWPQNQSFYSALYQVIARSYTPYSDDARLRSNPADFEAWRNNYPLRREFQAYKVSEAPEEARKILKNLGFSL